jgi:putative endonuclease
MGNLYFVYIPTNAWNTVLYTGVTSDLKARVYQHREKLLPGFTSRYNVWKLVYYETGYEGRRRNYPRETDQGRFTSEENRAD